MTFFPDFFQFDPMSEPDSILSFFNLEIELLIEGLPGALACDEYKFHFERGYGDSYMTNVS